MKDDTIKIDFSKKALTANLNAVGFEEGNSFVVYIASLELSAYGDNFDEANEMLKISLDEFSKEIFKMPMNRALGILKDLGWKSNKIFKKRMVNLSETTFDDIKKEFNLPENTPVREFPIAV